MLGDSITKLLMLNSGGVPGLYRKQRLPDHFLKEFTLSPEVYSLIPYVTELCTGLRVCSE